MSAPSNRVPIMAGACVLLGAVVVADRAGWFAGEAALEADTPAARYAEQTQRAGGDAALLDRADAWRSAAERGEAEWRRARAGLVRGATAELAETRFREIVKAAMQDIPLVSPERINYVRDAAAPKGAIQTLRLSLAFDAPSPKDAYTIIDRLENLPDARARIELMKIDGPGRIQAPEQVTVTLTLSAAALIGEEEPAL